MAGAQSPLTIFLITHSHVDNGYTERQERIARYQSQFIHQAVQCAESDKSRTDARSRFKFTCESFWAIEHYLRRYGAAGEEALLDGMRSGALELTAFYVHTADLLDYDGVVDGLSRARAFGDAHGIHMDTAVSCDVNGFSWPMVDALADQGIRYLMTAINTHHGGAPFGRPLVPFRWESPTGQTVLVWSGMPYHMANLLGVMPGFNPMPDLGLPGMSDTNEEGTVYVKDLTYARKRILGFANALRKIGYPYPCVPILGSGLYTDNSPISGGFTAIVEAWNAQHGDEVEIVTATAGEYMRHLEAHVPDIPTHRGDWNDWWTDGVMSTPGDVKVFRHAQRTKNILRRLDRDDTIPPEQIRKLSDSLIMFAEHTWGHSASQSEPWASLVQQLGKRKAKYAIDADVLASELLDDQLAQYGEGDFIVDRPFRYRCINYTDRDKRGLVQLPVDFWENDAIRSGYRIRASDNSEYATQLTETLRGMYICLAADIGAKDSSSFEIELTGETSVNGTNENGALTGMCFENAYYRLEWNSTGIHSLTLKHVDCGNVLRDGECLGEPVYQLFEDGERSIAAGFGYGSRSKPEDAIYRGTVQSVIVLETGPVFTRLKITYVVQGTSHYAVILTLCNALPTIEMAIEVTKDVVVDPEGLYAALPFAIPGGQWFLDKLGVMMLPGRDQLPRTCCDYYSVTHGAALVNEQTAIAISTLDSPLVTIGGIKLWDFTTDIEPVGTVYSWLTNNKWETNFKVECGGLYEFRYVIDCGPSTAGLDDAQARIIDNSYDILTVRA